MITLALDISTHSTGAAVFDQKKLVQSKCITAYSQNVFNRIDKITKEIQQLVIKYKPATIVVESPLPADVGHNIDTYRKLTWAQGIIGNMLNKHGLKFDVMFIPSEWRKKVQIKTGPKKKRASLKQDDIDMVKQLFDKQVNDDEADAILIGYAYVKQTRGVINWE